MIFHFKKWGLRHSVFCRQICSWNVMFFGSDLFSLKSLKILQENAGQMKPINKLEVITSLKNKLNPLVPFCMKNNITVHGWPLENFQNQEFQIGIVVSFGHLIPKLIIEEFPFGIINVHASLLPRWRGAAPIMHALINGDKETGVSIMRIQPHHFDTGDVILQKACMIGDDELMPSLHERLSVLGAECLLETIQRLPGCLDSAKAQPQDDSLITYAPRITRTAAIVRWDVLTATEVYNLYRGIHGLSDLLTYWHSVLVKLMGVVNTNQTSFLVDVEQREVKAPGDTHYCRSSKQLYIRCKSNTWISVSYLKIGGKKIKPVDFYNGYITRVPLEKRYFSST